MPIDLKRTYWVMLNEFDKKIKFCCRKGTK